MIKAGIIGGAGYTGGELLRLLLNHPECEIAFVTSQSQTGLEISSVHRDLIGETKLKFTKQPGDDADIIFLCMGHGESLKYFQQYPFDNSVKIIDLSQDYRCGDDRFVYGLPEAFREEISKADRIANPGCFATAIQLSLLPLFKHHLIKNDIHVTGITGSTGAGQAFSKTTHYSWRNSNVSVYKPFQHQHLEETNQTFEDISGSNIPSVYFTPIRGNFTRGIFVSSYTKTEEKRDRIEKLYTDYYKSHPFTLVIPSNPDLKQVVNTNKAIVYVDKIKDVVHVVCILDNLLKGAVGQAVQNMNIMFSLPEKTGLSLKSTAF